MRTAIILAGIFMSLTTLADTGLHKVVTYYKATYRANYGEAISFFSIGFNLSEDGKVCEAISQNDRFPCEFSGFINGLKEPGEAYISTEKFNQLLRESIRQNSDPQLAERLIKRVTSRERDKTGVGVSIEAVRSKHGISIENYNNNKELISRDYLDIEMKSSLHSIGDGF